MVAVELVDNDGRPSPTAFQAVAAHAREAGLVILPCGPEADIIRFIPPLNVCMEDLDSGIDMLGGGLAAYES